MSKHCIEFSSTTKTGRALVAVGYENAQDGKRLFCWLFDASEPIPTVLWSSLFSAETRLAKNVDDFDLELTQWGVVIPHFIKEALAQDWLQNSLNAEHCWHEDGTCERMI